MAFQLSPGVNASEIDLTTIIPSVASTAGAFAGQFIWGPVEQRTLINDELGLVDIFGKPDANTYEDFYTAANFLSYGSNLTVVRVSNTQLKNATANGGGLLIKNQNSYEANNASGTNNQGEWGAKYPGAIGNSLKVSMCAGQNAFSSNITSLNAITANVSNNSGVITFSGSVATLVANGDYINVGSQGWVQVGNVSGTTANTAPGTFPIPTTSPALTGAVVLRKWEYADKFLSKPTTSTKAVALGGANDELHVVVVDEDGKFSGTVGTVLEKFQFLSKATDAKYDDGTSQYYKNYINSNSRYIWWLDHSASVSANWSGGTLASAFSEMTVPLTKSLAGGFDQNPTDGEFLTAYGQFSNPDTIDVSLVLGGASDSTVATYLINSIAEVRKDCVVFLSPNRTDTINANGNELTNIQTFRDVLPSSSYAFMDSGWKYQYDKYNDVYRWVPLNGDTAGLCVRTDNDRDPWFSPAGFNRGNVKNVVKLSWNPNKSDRDELYKKGVNPVVSFPGEGTVLYGDKTLQSKPSAFDRINVRRLFIILEKSISRAAKYTLFEFNDQFTRSQFVAMVEPFLRLVQGRRGITDFRVVCDETNNSGTVVDRNEFVGDIYVKFARSINFIQLNFVAARSSVSFDEIVGKF